MQWFDLCTGGATVSEDLNALVLLILFPGGIITTFTMAKCSKSLHFGKLHEVQHLCASCHQPFKPESLMYGPDRQIDALLTLVMLGINILRWRDGCKASSL